jgi:hypothetical protein
MRISTAILLVATAFCGTSPAFGAKYLAFDFQAAGVGDEFTGINGSATPEIQRRFNQFYGTFYYSLEEGQPPQPGPSGIYYRGTGASTNVTGYSNGSGFYFEALGPLPTDVETATYAITGMACYSNANPLIMPEGPYSADPSCGHIYAGYDDGSGAYRYSFAGTVQSVNFRIVEADSNPGITFAIPEPSTWALMLTGLGMVGYAMRRRKLAFA